MGEMTPEQFEVVAELLRSQEPVRTAVRMVLVDGAGSREAADAAGLAAQQSVTNALRRYRNAHQKLLRAYDRP